MTIGLSEELKQALANLPAGQPLSVENGEYVIIRRDVYEQLRLAVQNDDSEPDPREFYGAVARAVAEDIDAPGMEAYDNYDAHRAKS